MRHISLAIVSTTIHGEAGYLPFDRLAAKSKFSSVVFVVAGDLKSAPFDTTKFQCPVEYIDASAQRMYHSSEPMGWNKIMRRNIALIRAIEKRPDYILMIDDDNIPEENYFDQWYEVITTPKRSIVTASPDAESPVWHNYLASSDADIEIYPRGFPILFRGRHESRIEEGPEVIAPEAIGVFQGLSVGDPDVDAKTRIVYPKPITLVKEKNYCLRDVWSPYNTQNTIFGKILFPLAFVWPHCGRYDDIYSSFAWQRFLFNNGLWAHIGDPVNRQERRMRNMKDLADEFEGYLHAHEVWEAINGIAEKDPLRFIARLAESDHEIIKRQRDFMLAFLQDLERVL